MKNAVSRGLSAVTLVTFVCGLLRPAWAAPPMPDALPDDAVVRDVRPEWKNDAPAAPDPNRPAPVDDVTHARRGESQGSTASASASLAGGGSLPAVSAQAISVPKGQGSIDGMGESFSAQLSTGTASFSIPIKVPPARGAVQPRLALNYSSGGGAGVAGIGWSFGVPYIARQTDRGVPVYRDTTDGSFSFDQDRFVFNGGQELVPLCVVKSRACAAAAAETMPDWSDGWMYFRSRVEGGFQRFFLSADRKTWRVQDKSGAELELGVPLDGSGDMNAVENDPDRPERIFRWNLAREYDASGPVNRVVYRYEAVENTSYLSDVYDTPPAAGSATNEFESYAHHVKLSYESRTDPSFSYLRKWRAALTRRLARVDVTSKTMSATSARELVRRYHLGYVGGQRTTLLERVQMEGRCASSIKEDASGTLPDSNCPKLPPVTFGYSASADSSEAKTAFGDLGVFSDKPHFMATTPGRSVSDDDIDVADINGDGLPDVLQTSPTTTAPEHSIYFNTGGTFGGETRLGIAPGAPASLKFITLSNSSIAALDVDADAKLDLVYMPTGSSSIFSIGRTGNDWKWFSRPMVTPTNGSIALDMTGNHADIRVMDVNGDGLVDIVHREWDTMSTYLSLGRYPGGDGRFGSAKWASPSTATFNNVPLQGCIPGDAYPVSFDDPEIRTADMNGDGIVDIVRMRSHRFEYWPGRGSGTWGVVPPSGCAPTRPPGVSPEIEMSNPPPVVLSKLDFVHFADMNQDGFDDIVQVGGQSATIYFNLGGARFSNGLLIRDTRLPNASTDLVRLVDVDGSGTRDIFWGSRTGYAYVDVLGGVRPNLLTSTSNGFGKTTTIDYASSAQLMLEAEKAGCPWAEKMPIVVSAVRRVTVTDNLAVAGRAASKLVTEYSYRDPVFDGRQREFRGFREATERQSGDANSPPSSTRTVYLTGDCADETADTVDDCEPSGRWRDNGREALKGVPVITETFDDAGVYLSTSHTTYTLRHLYTGLDGRSVRHAFASGADVWRYDTASFAPAASTLSLPDVVLDGAGGPAPTSSVTLRSTAGRAHYRESTTLDRFGNATSTTKLGCVDGCPTVDEAVTAGADFTLPPGDPSGWRYRATHTWTEGTATPRRGEQFTELDARGYVRVTRSLLHGTEALDRFHENSSSATAPAPASASADGKIVVAAQDVDAFGNVVFARGPNNRCSAIELDPAYASLPVTESIYVGAVGADRGPSGSTASAAFASAPGGSGCGDTALTATGVYDRGFAKATIAVDLHGEKTTAAYDGFGRLAALFRPDPSLIGMSEAAAAIEVSYDIDDTGKRPYAIIHTTTAAGASTFGADGAPVAAVGKQERWSYLDGFGRTVATLEQADPAAGDPGAWIVAGLTEYDAKGNARRVFLPWALNVAPNAFPLGTAPTTSATTHEYDAFGREFRTTDTGGEVALEKHFHAFSTDIWDAADLRSTTHQGTYTTERKNGHDKVVAIVQRLKVGGSLVTSETKTDYLATGEAIRIVRTAGASAPVARWMAYDSLGRMVRNVDPHTTKNFAAGGPAGGAMKTLRYAYNDAGDIVGTSDARGCGVNYFYDAGGRQIAEDYSPCTSAQPAYSKPDLGTGNGTEVFRVYDVPSPVAAPDCSQTSALLLGRVSATFDRGSHVVTAYDARGRTVCAARRVAKPGAPEHALGDRYAANWFSQQFVFDDADRSIKQSTGATSRELLGADGTSSIVTSYTARGLVGVASSSYGPLVDAVLRDASGKVTSVQYADAAKTRTKFAYDAKERLETVLTDRGAAALWSTTTANYTPAPTSVLSTLQLVLDDLKFVYDEVGNPTVIRDGRDPAAWPSGAKPTTRTMAYDDLYRIAEVTYQRGASGDPWTSPHDAENRRVDTDARRGEPAPHVEFAHRVTQETFAYDAFGNARASDDDTHGFYDRSLGTITNGASTGRPYQLSSATNEDGGSSRKGHLATAYDDAGHMTGLSVVRDGTCLPTGATCSQRFAYDWDEIGNLLRARRWDLADPGLPDAAPPTTAAAVELRFAYDSSKQRVLKTAVDAARNESHTVYAAATIELRGASYTDDAFERTAQTEVPYLYAHGVRLARVVFAQKNVPTATSGRLHVYIELADHLGSTGNVIDKDTGELVESTTYAAYGATESDYRPERWASFREDHRFTGKEEDSEVGLTYFGHRYYAPALGRWISPDPLAVHAPGEADLNLYAYVHGAVFVAVDIAGLEEWEWKGRNPIGETLYVWGIGQSIKESAASFKQAIENPKIIKDAVVKAYDTGGIQEVGRQMFVAPIVDSYHASVEAKRVGDDMEAGRTAGHLAIALLPAAGVVGTARNLAAAGVKALARGATIAPVGVLAAEGVGDVGVGVLAAETAEAASEPAATAGKVAAESASAVEKTTVGPVRNAHLAGKMHPKTGVPFDKNGYPDFSKWRHPEIADVRIELSGNRGTDFARANAAAGLKETPAGWTWHHHQDKGLMQLVDRGIHAATGHTGGFK